MPESLGLSKLESLVVLTPGALIKLLQQGGTRGKLRIADGQGTRSSPVELDQSFL